MTDDIELSVVIPCLNESKTIGECVEKALRCMFDNGVRGEVLIADNGSTDGSAEVAMQTADLFRREVGSTGIFLRIVNADVKGYGSAIRTGIDHAYGKYCIMADADCSYDFSLLIPYLDRLRAGYDLVMGNRFWGGIEKGAMPFLHRYLGTPVLSLIGRILFHNRIGDYNCGMRGMNTGRIRELGLKCSGMEFASEMIIRCSQERYLIAEVPTTLSKDKRDRKPHLNTWRDGWRHLMMMLRYRFFPGRSSK